MTATQILMGCQVSLALEIPTILMSTLSDHEKDPFPIHSLESYEQARRAAFETVAAKMAEQVEIWKSGIDSTLIFVS